MLFEVARGNFNLIPLSSNDEGVETLVVLINMVAEEMKESVFKLVTLIHIRHFNLQL
jgi:hypothetical protein